jgi:hypothetical protein
LGRKTNSYADDQGGNKIEPVTGGFYPIPSRYPLNLHSVWDGAIIRKAIAEPGWKAFAHDLQDRITDAQRHEWLAAPPLAWIQESYDITTSRFVEYCRKADGQRSVHAPGGVDQQRARAVLKAHLIGETKPAAPP